MSFKFKHVDNQNNTYISLLNISLGIVALIIGGIIYLAFRSLSLPMFSWIETLGFMGIVDELRLISIDITPGNFVLYNLPDLLWIISYLLFVNGIMSKQNRVTYIFWVLFLPVLAVCHEILQGLGVMSGSFDVVDLLCYIFPTTINIISISIFKFNFKLTTISYEKNL